MRHMVQMRRCGHTSSFGVFKIQNAYLETSIGRHKARIMKIELILRLLDNDELSPDQVNDLKEYIEDYVERNQDDFEQFGDVDDFYSSLPLDKVTVLQDMVTLCPSGYSKDHLMSQQMQSYYFSFGHLVEAILFMVH